MGVFDVSATSLFPTSASQNARMENLAQRVLSNALEQFVARKYDDAISTFKRAIGMAPRSSTAIDAYDYLARAYLAKDDSRAAIDAYQQSLRLEPRNAGAHLALGNIYISLEQPDKAQAAYEQAVRLDPSATNRYALGQSYLEAGRYRDAELQFKLVREQEAGKPNGDYGLGLVYARQGRNTDAIAAFERAISLQRDFWYAHAELGYVLTDSGEREKALEIAGTLQEAAPDLAATLSAYITQETPPRMIAAYATGTFPKTLGPRTQVADLGEYLADAGDQQTFSMLFQFSKPMDAISVENVLNWRIARSLDTGHGDAYNFGMPPPATEISLSPYPVSVSYDEEAMAATVLFRIQQNATADGTLDPSHIQFSFRGSDVFGVGMDAAADQYTGFSGFA
jgi:tetratricopeptide (TPR) repeat protein